MAESDAEAIRRAAADLKVALHSLDTYIEHRAREIAAPRIAAAEQTAAERIAETEMRLCAEIQRQADLIAEFRRQMKVLDRLQGRWRALIQACQRADREEGQARGVSYGTGALLTEEIRAVLDGREVVAVDDK